jgi:uncharacterized protein YukE
VINGGGPSPAGSAAFPDPPKGSPGEIAACAHTLSGAADDLERADAGLRGVSSGLQADWQGYAAAAYHSSSEALASVARGGSQTFRECAHAVSGYGTALDHAQSEIRRLRTLYDDAKIRQAAAANLAGRLGTALMAAHKQPEVTRLETQVTTVQGQSQDAGTEADGYARRATTVLTEFKQASRGYEQTLSGVQPGQPGGPLGSPFSPTGHPGPGFGAPFNSFSMPGAGGLVPGGLSAYNGVIPVGNPWASPIPGYGYYKDATTPEAVPDGDLTNLILLLGPIAAAPLKELGGEALSALARELGLGAGGRTAVEEAGQSAAVKRGLARLETVLDKDGKEVLGPDGQPLTKIGPGQAAQRRLAEAEQQIQQDTNRIELGNRIADGLDKLHAMPLPESVRTILVHVAEHRIVYVTAVAAQLTTARDALLRAGTPVALRAAQVLDGILSHVGR